MRNLSRHLASLAVLLVLFAYLIGATSFEDAAVLILANAAMWIIDSDAP